MRNGRNKARGLSRSTSSYVINYNLGEDMVRSYIEKRGGTEQQPEQRWHDFEQLLASPRLPGDIR